MKRRDLLKWLGLAPAALPLMESVKAAAPEPVLEPDLYPKIGSYPIGGTPRVWRMELHSSAAVGQVVVQYYYEEV